MIDQITPVIICCNAKDTIYETLSSLHAFKDVLVYINQSTDNTAEIVKQFNNVSLIEGEFIGFGPTRNAAAKHVNTPWIFAIDSDEVLSDALLKSFKALKLSSPSVVYEILRENYFLGKHVKFGGWGRDYLIRLYHKDHHSFTDDAVHERLECLAQTKVIRLKQSLKHNAIINVNQFLEKIIRYSDLADTTSRPCSFLSVWLRANYAFFKSYILQFGFLEGYRGFVIAVSNYNGRFYRYTKRYINCRKK